MVIIGSARINEKGTINGGKKGDQTGKEVSTQQFYLHSKGWRVLRPTQKIIAEHIAYAMQALCDNPHFGYGQEDRKTGWAACEKVGFDPAKVMTDVNIDCSESVRVCVAYAGIRVDSFSTASEAKVLLATGLFTEQKYTGEDDLHQGDILVTKTKGHTVVVLTNGKNVIVSPVPVKPNTSYAKNVAEGQKWLNDNYARQLDDFCGGLLVVDGEYGKQTRNGCLAVWKDLSNRKYGTTLTPTNTNFGDSCKKAAKYATVRLNSRGTFPYIVQLILSAKGFYKDSMDAKFGKVSVAALEQYQRSEGLTVDGVCGPQTWYRLFN